MEMYSNVILTLLTIVTGILAIVGFANGRTKEQSNSGKQIGKIEQKIDDIDERTESIQRDVKELRGELNSANQTAIKAYESSKSAHKRIDELETRMRERYNSHQNE